MAMHSHVEHGNEYRLENGNAFPRGIWEREMVNFKQDSLHYTSSNIMNPIKYLGYRDLQILARSFSGS